MNSKRPAPLDFGSNLKVTITPNPPMLAQPEPGLETQPAPEPEPQIEAEPDIDLAIADGPVFDSTFPFAFSEPAEGAVTPRRETPVEPPPQQERHFRPAPPEPQVGGRIGYVAAFLFSLIWGVSLATFWIGYQSKLGPFESAPFAAVVVALLAAGPIALAFVLAYALKQAAHIVAEARYARALAAEMLQPAALASLGAGSAVEAVRREIENAAAAAGQARHEIKTLSEILAGETAKLIDSAAAAARTAGSLTDAFAHERTELANLATALDGQATAVTEAINSQAEMVSQASDLAETQIREAQASLLARAADLASAADSTTDAARAASEDLERQTARLEAAGVGVTDQVRVVEEGLAEQRAALVAVSHSLRAEQEDFAAQIESQQAQLAEILANARDETQVLEDTATKGGAALRELVTQVTDQYRELADAASQERDLFGVAALQSAGALSEAMRHERDTLKDETQQAITQMSQAADEARTAAAAQAETARRRIDELGEAAFSAGQRADAAFESRISEARALIEQSTSLVEEAGLKANERLAKSLESTRAVVTQIEDLLKDVEQRTARMPADAEARGAEVKAAVEQGVDDLLSAARRASEETQAIDAAFQERVHRNYEMLSEAVRLMGVVGGVAPPRPARPTRPELGLRGTVAPARPADAEPAEPRTRLKLTPTASDEEFNSVFEQAGARAEGTEVEGQDWTWKDLLSSIDESPDGEDRLADRLIGEIDGLGIDPAALMPRPRLEEIGATLQAKDQTGAREVVRKLAPAAVRRLSRKILTDISLRNTANRFLKRFEAAIEEAITRDGEGVALTDLLVTPQGRAFLLIDAAVGDLA